MIVESAIGVAATLVAAGFAAHRIEQLMLAAKGFDTRDFFKPISGEPAKPAVDPAPPSSRAEDEREMKLFMETGAWWLDPNRWGDDPDWRSRIPGPIYNTPTAKARKGTKPPEPATEKRPCPWCGSKDVTIAAEHGGEATEWQCNTCAKFYTRSTRVKRDVVQEARARAVRLEKGLTTPFDEAAAAAYADAFDDMPAPPAMPDFRQPPAVYRPEAAFTAHMADHLPCGCPHHSPTERRHSGKGGHWSYTRCLACRRWWEPASNDPTGRRMAPGEMIHSELSCPPDGIEAWDRRNRRGETNHGACPRCTFPVERSKSGVYRCTDTGCEKHVRTRR